MTASRKHRAEKAARREARIAAQAAIKGANLEELRTMAAELGREMAMRAAAVNELRVRLDAVQMEIEARRTSTSVGVHISDHAVLRYLERVRGVDVYAVREEIVALAERAGKIGKRRNLGALVDDESGLTIGISRENTVTTVYKEKDHVVLHMPTISG